MTEYHKIKNLYKRNPETGKLIKGEFAVPEFEYLFNNVWVFTEKIDGTNIRVIWDGKGISFKGKTDKAQIPSFLLNKLHILFQGSEGIFTKLFGEKEVCLYGEGYGAKIQSVGSQYIPNGNNFILFDVKIGGHWLSREDVEDIARKFVLDIVPVVFVGSPEYAIMNLVSGEGFQSKIANLTAEGLIGTPLNGLKTRSGERIIVKLKHRDFKKL